MTNKLKLDVNNFGNVKKDMKRIENTLQRIQKYENYKKVLDDIAIKALENEDAEVKMNLNVQITKKIEVIEGKESPKQILDRIKSADSADSFMKAIGDIEKVLEGGATGTKKNQGFFLDTDISDLTNVTFLAMLEAMQTVLEKQIKKLHNTIK